MTLMQTPSKAGDLDGEGRRSRDVEAVWVMPLQAKGCHRLPAPQSPEDRRPLVASRGPQPCRQTACSWTSGPPRRESVFCAPCGDWSSSVGFTGPSALPAVCVRTQCVCGAGMNHHVNLQRLLPGLQPGTGGRGWVPGAARLGQGGFMKG